MERKIIVSVKNLSKEYKLGVNTVLALKSVHLEIREGDFVAITGKSGSGKSTLLHMLGALDHPTEGVININGKEITELSDNRLAEFRRDEIGFVFQNFSLLPELKAIENIVLPALLKGNTVDMDYLKDIINALELQECQDHMPDQMSGGQQQRTAIARALVNKPLLILCDEPTGNLDKKTGTNVMNMLLQMHEQYHTTLIVVTHDPEIAEMADYRFVMEDGNCKKEYG